MLHGDWFWFDRMGSPDTTLTACSDSTGSGTILMLEWWNTHTRLLHLMALHRCRSFGSRRGGLCTSICSPLPSSIIHNRHCDDPQLWSQTAGSAPLPRPPRWVGQFAGAGVAEVAVAGVSPRLSRQTTLWAASLSGSTETLPECLVMPSCPPPDAVSTLRKVGYCWIKLQALVYDIFPPLNHCHNWLRHGSLSLQKLSLSWQ